MKLPRRSRGDREVNSAGGRSRSHREASTAPHTRADLAGVLHQEPSRFACPAPAPCRPTNPREKLMMMRTKTKAKTPSRLAHRANRRRQRDGHRGRRAWRESPATADQLAALRTIAETTGHTFKADVTRGEAWRRIRQATVALSPAARLRCAPPWYTAGASRPSPAGASREP